MEDYKQFNNDVENLSYHKITSQSSDLFLLNERTPNQSSLLLISDSAFSNERKHDLNLIQIVPSWDDYE